MARCGSATVRRTSRVLFLRSIGSTSQGSKKVIVKVQIVQNMVILLDFPNQRNRKVTEAFHEHTLRWLVMN